MYAFKYLIESVGLIKGVLFAHAHLHIYFHRFYCIFHTGSEQFNILINVLDNSTHLWKSLEVVSSLLLQLPNSFTWLALKTWSKPTKQLSSLYWLSAETGLGSFG